MFPCLGVGPGVERGGARLPGEVRWARDERVWVCELGLWRAGGGPAASGCACVSRVCVSACVCVSGGGSRPASPQGARVPGRVRVGRGTESGTPERRGPSASRPGLRASQVRTARREPTPWTREAVRPPRRRAAGSGGSGRGSRGRGRGRKRAGLQRGLTVFAPGGSSARPPASPDAPGTPSSRGPRALPRAWPGEGRGRDTRIVVACAASASPRGRGRHILAF